MKLAEAKDKLKIGDRVMVILLKSGAVLQAGILTFADEKNIVIIPKVKAACGKNPIQHGATIPTSDDSLGIFKR